MRKGAGFGSVTRGTQTLEMGTMCAGLCELGEDGHVICTLGTAVRRERNKVLGGHNKGLFKVCLLAVVGLEGGVSW